MTVVRALSGKLAADLTVDAMRSGEVGVADLRIHPETLERQAVVAELHGNPQLAGNLRRAAELTRLPDDEILAIYGALRPGRSTAARLTELAASLAERGLPLCAALVAEAAEVYARRGLVELPSGATTPRTPRPSGETPPRTPRPSGETPPRTSR